MHLCQPALHHWKHVADATSPRFINSPFYFGSALCKSAQVTEGPASRNSRQSHIQRKPLFLGHLEASFGAFQGASGVPAQEMHNGSHVMGKRYGVWLPKLLSQDKRFRNAGKGLVRMA